MAGRDFEAGDEKQGHHGLTSEPFVSETHDDSSATSSAPSSLRRDRHQHHHNTSSGADDKAEDSDGADPEDDDAIERIPTRRSAYLRATSVEMKRTASNVLANVASHVTTRSWPEPPPPPDGGFKAWLQVAMGWFCVCCTWGYVNSFSVFQTYYTGVLPLPPSTISWIGSVQTFCTLLIGAFSGRLLDAGFFRPTFLTGAIIQVLGIFTMSISTKFWHLMLTQGICTGIGGGIFFTPSMALVTTYFNKNRGIAVGLMTTGNSAGGIIYPVVVRQLLPKLGFAWTARVLGFINLACLATVYAFMRPRLPPRKSGPILDLGAFKEKPYAIYSVGLFFCMWANYFTFYFVASFATDALNQTYAAASILIIVLNGVGLPFRVILPFLADRIGVVNVVAPICLCWAVVAFCWLAVDSVGGYYAFTCFYGIFSGIFQALNPTVVASITPQMDMIGTRLGMLFSVGALASLTGPPVGGALLQVMGGSYTAAQIWAAVATLIGACMTVVCRYYLVGTKLKAKC